MPTANDLITRALKRIGYSNPPTAAEANDGLTILNSLLDSWSVNGLYVYAMQDITKALTAGQTAYTCGSGGDITTRPNRIPNVVLRDAAGTDFPLIELQKRQWDGIVNKSSPPNSYPDSYYYETSYPLAVLHLYPAPSSGQSAILSVWRLLQSFANLTTSLSLPPGYERLIVNGLAVEMAPDFGMSVSDGLLKSLTEATAAIKRHNSRPIISAPVEFASPGFNIYTRQ